ncbi:hypothetical protein [Jeongeupia sp. USM3]|uniref:hypothetical protein n=1 Tax=Jeongeupia sp. USM3 TaxID=1906741 RepID=UPI00089DD821|nr:hypothetical protein [Jeongeupia sp. USM3]AOY01898.1 hypothetical protein BJP62_16465 [Jeongeupia sp. USM3]
MFDFKALVGALFGRSEQQGVHDYKSATVLMQALPESDILQAQIEIVHALHQLNGNAGISLKERLRTVPYLDEKARSLQAHLVAVYRGELIDEGAAPHQILPTLLAFWREMADAYRLCVKQALQSGHNRNLQPYVLRGLIYAGERARWAMLRYADVDAGGWRQLHRLFQYAEALGCAQTPQQPYPGGELTDARREYLQVLMLALSGPEQLQTGQIELASRWLARWSAKIELESQIRPNRQLFAANLAGSTAPKRLRRDMVGDNWRYGSTDALIEHLQIVHDALAQGAAPAKYGLPDESAQPAGLELLARLIARWSRDTPPPVRRHERQTIKQTVSVWRGLDEAVQALRGAGRARQWEIVNESAHGLGIHCRAGSDDVQVGELLGIQGQDRRPFSVGIVRWISRKTDGTVDLGIETLAGSPIAVELTPMLGERSCAGLYVAETEQQGRLLILPQAFYADHREFRLGAKSKRYRIRLGNTVETTLHGALARFAVLEKLAA